MLEYSKNTFSTYQHVGRLTIEKLILWIQTLRLWGEEDLRVVNPLHP